jgi:ketosteroid isomerase-like protein
MPATTPEQVHRVFEDTFNAGDIDGLMELYESDAALIAQPGASPTAASRSKLHSRASWRSRATSRLIPNWW